MTVRSMVASLLAAASCTTCKKKTHALLAEGLLSASLANSSLDKWTSPLRCGLDDVASGAAARL